MQVVISDTAFVTIVAMALETYKKECLGILYGHRAENGFTIEYALPHQTARRKLSEVATYDRRLRAARGVVTELSSLEEIGDYHSHNDYGGDGTWTMPSEPDMRSMTIGNIYIVISVETCADKRAWHQQPTGAIVGSIKDKRVRVGAYYKKKAPEPFLASLWVAPGIMMPHGIGTFESAARENRTALVLN